LEEKWIEHTREHYRREIELAYEAFEAVMDGLDRLDGQDRTVEESARLTSIVQAFNSLKTALDTLQRGYYQQSLGLTRMALESWIVGRDASSRLETAEALLYGKGRLDSFAVMAERVLGDRRAWEANYGPLSEMGAHPRHASLAMVSTDTPEGERLLVLGGFYNERLAAFALDRVLMGLMTMMGEVTFMEPMWGVDYKSVFDEVAETVGEIRDKASTAGWWQSSPIPRPPIP
jgi:hypothetical protein